MPVVTKKTRRGFIYIPRNFIPNWKLEIVRSDGITDDLTDRILFLEFDRPVTEEIGRFEVHIENNDEAYANVYTGGETIRIYIDMSNATREQFEGYVENVKNTHGDMGYVLEITGTHVSSELIDITVTASYDAAQISGTAASILNDLISDYLDTTIWTSTNVASCTDTATINWSHKPFWHCVRDLCDIANYDCYIDNDKDFHFFERNSIECTLDAVVWEDNIIKIEGLGKDIADVKNKIIVYGEDNQGIPIIYTKEDGTSQTNYKTKELIIRDSAINTIAEAEDRATAELTLLKDPELKGTATCQGMIYVNPGEKIWVSIPPERIHAQYRILNIIHRIDMGDFTTQLELSKITKGIPKFFRERTEKELAIQKIENPNKLEYSYNFTFDDDTNCNHSNTETADGNLQLTSGQTSGTMTSDAHTTTDNITQVELRVVGEGLRDCTFEISVDNGITYQTIVKDTLYDTVATGKYLKIKAHLSNTTYNPRIDSLAILYR